MNTEINKIIFRNKYRIESTRLRDYDYSLNGAYFITICTKNRKNFFGEIVDEKLIETFQAQIAFDCWLDLPNHYSNCFLDEFIIMPNHIHGIIFIDNDNFLVETGLKQETGLKRETGLKPVSTTTDLTETGLKPVSTCVKINKAN